MKICLLNNCYVEDRLYPSGAEVECSQQTGEQLIRERNAEELTPQPPLPKGEAE